MKRSRPPPASVAPRETGTHDLEGLRLLVIGGSEDEGHRVAASLAGSGATPTFIDAGAAALDAAARERWDLMLIDVRVSDGADLGLVRLLRRAARDRRASPVPIVALGADARPATVRRALAAGCAAHLAKPVALQALIDALRLHGRSAGPFPGPALAARFLSRRAVEIVTAREALRRRELDTLETLGHNLRGSAAVYGFPRLGALGRRIEAAARAGDEMKLGELLARLAKGTAPARPPAPPSPQTSRTVGGTLLIVDDDEDTRALYAEYLACAGFTIIETDNGSDAVVRARQLLPDLVILDLTLPIVDGWAVSRELRSDARTHGIPVIALTGHARDDSPRGAGDATCDLFLTKPCLPEALLARVRELLEQLGPVRRPGQPRPASAPWK